mgnify:CR=1 FL=1
MSKKPISEKTAGILFSRFIMQAFLLGEVSLFAPTSAEEFKNGYGTALRGGNNSRELCLQFKSPRYSKKRDGCTITF